MAAGKKNSTPSGRVLGHSKRVLPRLRFILLAAAFVFPLYAGKVQAVVSGGPESAGPLQIALEVLGAGTSSNAGDSSDSLPTVRVRDQYTSLHNKVTHIFLRQEVGGLEVFGEDISIGISSPGEVLNLDNRVRKYTVPALAARQLFLSPQAALRAAAAHLGLRDPGDPRILNELGGIEQAVLFEGGTLSNGSIPLKLMVQPDGTGGLYTVWNMHFETKNGIHWWHVNIDAVTGEVRFENDWSWRASYRVVGLPHSSPEDGVVSLHVDVHDPVASPFGWHDTNGIVGSEYTDTRGNNVFAQLDANGDNYADFRPDGGSLLSFDYSPDFSADPAQSSSSSVVNLFYMNNLLHDIHYHYGFTEVAGNFQVNNYNRGGVGGDPLQADAQDGSAFNNASMLTPPDGFDPRMQAHIWLHGGGTLVVHSPPSLARDYQFGVAQFGARLDGSGVSGLVVQALDPPDPPLYSTMDACAPITNGLELAGNLALIDRGECVFVEKVLHVQNAGAVAALIVNHEGDHLVTMGGEEPEIVIPALFLGQSDGDAIRAAITSGTPVMATITVSTALDGAFDNEIIIHEYGHGVSTRLTGGPSNSDCLHAAQSEGMGEGWSDWWALVLTTESNDVSDAPRPIGAYANGGANIRLHPYSTDMAVNPWTYDDLNRLSEEHDIGEVWCAVLWDLYWLLVEKHGFDPDVYSGTGGNNVALQLVMDGLKLQPCNPSFLDGRDAILLADVVNNGGENTCEIWEAFARRGMGEDAEDGGSATSTAVTAGFSTPSSCLPQLEFTVSAATGWGRGTITPSGNIVTSEGQSLTFTAEPFAGYVVLRWLLDGRTVQTGGETYTLANIDADHNVSVYFSLVPTQYTIVASSSGNGTVIPSGAFSVPNGGWVVFGVSPDPHYEVDLWILDGSTTQAGGRNFILDDIQSSHTVHVTFRQIIHTVAASSGTGGSILPSGNVVVSDGVDIAFEAVPDSLYSIGDWVLDGVTAQNGGQHYTVEDIAGDHALHVAFQYDPPEYTVSASASTSGGAVSPTSISATHGDSIIFTAVPNPGFFVHEWRRDGALEQSGGTSYILTNIVDHYSVSASFFLNTPPDVKLIDPHCGARFTESPNIWFSAVASDAETEVSQISIFVDGVVQASSNGNSVTHTWNAAPTGSFSVMARAWDSLGAESASSIVPIHVYPDQDGDGLPDWWEMQFFNSTTGTDPETVTASGFTVEKHYAAGTDPNNDTNFMQIAGLSVVGSDTLSVSWNSVEGRCYSVYSSDFGKDLGNKSLAAGPFLATSDFMTATNISIVNGAPRLLFVGVHYIPWASANAPFIETEATLSPQVTVPFSYQVQASNNPDIYSAIGLPAGLGISTASGLINGIPAAPGFYSTTITAGNEAGNHSRTMSFQVRSAPFVRFTDNGNGTVTDNSSGRMWVKNAAASGKAMWYTAEKYCSDLNYGGHSDWRMPNWEDVGTIRYPPRPLCQCE